MACNQASCSMRLLKQLHCTLPSLFLLPSFSLPFTCLVFYFVWYVICLLFWWNGCRENCCAVNWSILARLKPVDSVAYRHYCRQRPVLGCYLFQQSTRSYWHHLSLTSAAQSSQHYYPTHTIKTKEFTTQIRDEVIKKYKEEFDFKNILSFKISQSNVKFMT